LVNEKHFSFKEKFGLIFMKVFSFSFGRKTLSRSCEKFRNIILFIDYIKFGPQTFDWYIFCLNLFFSSLKIWFNFIFILTLVLIFMIVICFSLIFFLIEIFYLSNLILIVLIITYFIWNNLWNCNYYYYFNFIIFQIFYLLDLISIILIIIYFF
jgi:hypothetical protein